MDEYERIEGKYEYAVIRLTNGELLDIRVAQWEGHKQDFPQTSAVEVVRGLTKEDAANLTLLVNKQMEKEYE